MGPVTPNRPQCGSTYSQKQQGKECEIARGSWPKWGDKIDAIERFGRDTPHIDVASPETIAFDEVNARWWSIETRGRRTDVPRHCRETVDRH